LGRLEYIVILVYWRKPDVRPHQACGDRPLGGSLKCYPTERNALKLSHWESVSLPWSRLAASALCETLLSQRGAQIPHFYWVTEWFHRRLNVVLSIYLVSVIT